MPELPSLPPISTQPVSVVLLARDAAAHLEADVAGWVAYLNGLDQPSELLLAAAGADGTPTLAAALSARYARLKVLAAPDRPGEGDLLRAALAEARHPLVFYSRCDPRYPPANLKRLLQAIDPVHLVSGYRAGRPVPWFWRTTGGLLRGFWRLVFGQASRPLPGWLGWQRHAGQLVARLLFGVHYRDCSCPCRLLRREILARIPLQSDGPFAHVEVLAKANFLGCLLGEEIPLGDRLRPVVPDPLPPGGARQALREAVRLFLHPDFGPPVVPAPAPTA